MHLSILFRTTSLLMVVGTLGFLLPEFAIAAISFEECIKTKTYPENLSCFDANSPVMAFPPQTGGSILPPVNFGSQGDGTIWQINPKSQFDFDLKNLNGQGIFLPSQNLPQTQ